MPIFDNIQGPMWIKLIQNSLNNTAFIMQLKFKTDKAHHCDVGIF